MNPKIEVLSDKTALIQRSLDLVVAQMKAAIAERGQFTIALAGGSTPKPLYEAIAAQDLPWKQFQVFWGDERYVPHEHPDSNAGMAYETWLEQVDMPARNVHPIHTDEADPAVAARKHEQQLHQFFQTKPGQFPTLDLILLGIGDDAHTASLFPHTEALKVRDRLVTVGNKDGQPRITFTVPFINQARCVMFLVSGASKQTALNAIFAPEADPMTYPARLIQPQGDLWWLLDQAAGQGLS